MEMLFTGGDAPSSSSTAVSVVQTARLHSAVVQLDQPHEQQQQLQQQCLHYVDQQPDPSNSAWAITLFLVLYSNIFVLGLLGNLAIVIVTIRCQHLRSVQNIFILNLAISDIIVCLLSLPFTPVSYIYKEWLFGSAICHLLPMVQAASVFVSTFSLSAIAIDRYWLVLYPHSGSISPAKATVVAAVLWLLSVLISVPYSVHMTLVEYDGYCGKFCTEQWPSTQIRRGYALSVLVLQFLIPRRANSKLQKLNERQTMLAKLSNAAAADGSIGEKCQSVDNLCRVPSRSDSDRAHRVHAVSKQQRRTTLILVTIVLFFFFAWLPHNIREMVIEYDEQLLHWNNINYTYFLSMVTHSVAMTTNVANPILYAWLNPTFKEVFLRTANSLLLRRKMHSGASGGSVRSEHGTSCGDRRQATPPQQKKQLLQQRESSNRDTQQTTCISLGNGQMLVQANGAGALERPKNEYI
uniref:G-protein coupled receptors family 1 profile domain-containing protein n=1 Tax=Globodera rostochiensis TaxID=31243 RepID=A0A914HR17_GLORO